MNNKENVSFTEMNKAINIKEHIDIIKRRLWVLVLITILTTSYGIAKNILTIPVYQSSTRIIIGADVETMKTLLVLVTDTSVMKRVANDLGTNISPDVLASQINVSTINDSKVVNIVVTDSDPRRAAEIADLTAQDFKNELPNLYGSTNVTLLSGAKVNPYPINISGIRRIITYFLIGLVLGIGLIYLLYSLDDSIGSNEDIENTLGLPILGTVSKMNNRNMRNSGNIKKINDPSVRGETIGY